MVQKLQTYSIFQYVEQSALFLRHYLKQLFLRLLNLERVDETNL